MRSSLRKMADLKAALDESTVVAITDENGKITYVNDKFCEISKYYMEELVGQDHRILNSGYHTREFFENLWSTIARGDVWRGEIKNQAQDGSTLLGRDHHRAFHGRGRQARPILRHLQRHYQVQRG